ncbi:MAG TPA: hypothetical protein VEB41_01150 [Burkholderiales bacterium]|nr:hypothetical protein [Burkholderiales bacterium]
MSEAKEKAAAAAAVPETPYREVALQIYVNLAARVYGSPAAPDAKRPDPKVLAAMCFKMAEAFEAAEKETDRAKAINEARNKAAVKLDEVDLSSVINATKK